MRAFLFNRLLIERIKAPGSQSQPFLQQDWKGEATSRVEWSHRHEEEACKRPSGKDQKDNLYHGRQKRGLCGRGGPAGSQENVIVWEINRDHTVAFSSQPAQCARHTNQQCSPSQRHDLPLWQLRAGARACWWSRCHPQSPCHLWAFSTIPVSNDRRKQLEQAVTTRLLMKTRASASKTCQRLHHPMTTQESRNSKMYTIPLGAGFLSGESLPRFVWETINQNEIQKAWQCLCHSVFFFF